MLPALFYLIPRFIQKWEHCGEEINLIFKKQYQKTSVYCVLIAFCLKFKKKINIWFISMHFIQVTPFFISALLRANSRFQPRIKNWFKGYPIANILNSHHSNLLLVLTSQLGFVYEHAIYKISRYIDTWCGGDWYRTCFKFMV